MKRYFAKSLDRPVEMVGLKGGWIIVFIVLALISLLVGITIGVLTTAGYGISAVFILVFTAFIGCTMVQNTIPSRDLKKLKVSGKGTTYVVRRQTLNRILRPVKETRSRFFEEHKGDLEGLDMENLES